MCDSVQFLSNLHHRTDKTRNITQTKPQYRLLRRMHECYERMSEEDTGNDA